MADQTIEAKDCITPNSVAHELADNVMPAKANFRKQNSCSEQQGLPTGGQWGIQI